jgi:hypothetical protein
LTVTDSILGTETIGANGFQGWFSSSAENAVGPDGNTNYITGNLGGSLYNDFFVFSTAGLTNVTSATLSLNSDGISGPLTYKLSDVSTPFSTLYDGVSPNASVYNDLGSGLSYGAYGIDAGQSNTTLYFALNSAGLAAINADIAGGQFAVGGSVNSVPEPSNWALMLAGLAGLGVVGYRRSLTVAA